MVHDEFEEAFTQAGSVGLNASTSSDATRYVVNLPSNKVELWMALESDRFLNPVLREFYKEKDVVKEERRMRTESRPRGRLMEEFLAIAFKAHPYGEPTIGHMSDVETMTRSEAKEFFRKYYTPSNLTIAIVGDVHLEEIRSLAETYFGRIPAAPQPDPVETVEPPQTGQRRVVVEDRSQPWVVMGYHTPAIDHSDNAVFEAISDILGRGKNITSVQKPGQGKEDCRQCFRFPGFPGEQIPGALCVFCHTLSRAHHPGERGSGRYRD